MSKAVKAFKIAHKEATKNLLAFGTKYLCEQGFSSVMNMKTKYKNQLNAEDCTQIALTSKCSNFEAIVSNIVSPKREERLFKIFFCLIFLIRIFVCTTIIIIIFTFLKR